jgi:hypothetical protein
VATLFRCNSSTDGRLDVYDGIADSRIGAAYTAHADLLHCAFMAFPTLRSPTVTSERNVKILQHRALKRAAELREDATVDG